MPEWPADHVERLQQEISRLRDLNRRLTEDFNTMLLEEAKTRWRARELEREIERMVNEKARSLDSEQT